MTLRERLAAKKLPAALFRLCVDDATEAERELDEARRVLVMAGLGKPDEAEPSPDLTAAKERMEAAQAAYDACFEWLTLRALPPAAHEALLAEHPPTPEQRKDEPDAEYADTFRPALIAATIEGDLTGEEWLAFLAEQCSDGERMALFIAAIAINLRAPDPTVPKGSTGTLS